MLNCVSASCDVLLETRLAPGASLRSLRVSACVCLRERERERDVHTHTSSPAGAQVHAGPSQVVQRLLITGARAVVCVEMARILMTTIHTYTYIHILTYTYTHTHIYTTHTHTCTPVALA
jgi:hypothetical protein